MVRVCFFLFCLVVFCLLYIYIYNYCFCCFISCFFEVPWLNLVVFGGILVGFLGCFKEC